MRAEVDLVAAALHHGSGGARATTAEAHRIAHLARRVAGHTLEIIERNTDDVTLLGLPPLHTLDRAAHELVLEIAVTGMQLRCLALNLDRSIAMTDRRRNRTSHGGILRLVSRQ